MGKFARLTSPPKIYYTLTYFLLGRYFFLNSQRNSGHLHKKVRGISQEFSIKNYESWASQHKYVSGGGGKGLIRNFSNNYVGNLKV